MPICRMNFSGRLKRISSHLFTCFFLLTCRELCDGLHSNVYLNKLDLRLGGNQLETFVHEYAVRFATIPSLTTLDISGCGMKNVLLSFLI